MTEISKISLKVAKNGLRVESGLNQDLNLEQGQAEHDNDVVNMNECYLDFF